MVPSFIARSSLCIVQLLPFLTSCWVQAVGQKNLSPISLLGYCNVVTIKTTIIIIIIIIIIIVVAAVIIIIIIIIIIIHSTDSCDLCLPLLVGGDAGH